MLSTPDEVAKYLTEPQLRKMWDINLKSCEKITDNKLKLLYA